MKVEPIETRAPNLSRTNAGVVRYQQVLDLLVLAALALLLSGLLPVPLPVLRVPLGLAFILFAPGYVLTAALFPRRDHLDVVERATLSFGLSIAVLPVLTLVLDTLHWGIRPLPIALSLTLWIVFLCAVSAVRRFLTVPAEAAFAPLAFDLSNVSQVASRHLGARGGIRAIALTGLLVAATVLLLPVAPEHPTEFYILGQGRQAEEYPRDATRGDDLTVTIGIVNAEGDRRTYRLEVWVVDTWGSAGRVKVAEDGPISLVAGQRWERPISWRMPRVGNDQQVEFLLFAQDNPEPYRRLHLWLDVREARRLR